MSRFIISKEVVDNMIKTELTKLFVMWSFMALGTQIREMLWLPFIVALPLLLAHILYIRFVFKRAKQYKDQLYIISKAIEDSAFERSWYKNLSLPFWVVTCIGIMFSDTIGDYFYFIVVQGLMFTVLMLHMIASIYQLVLIRVLSLKVGLLKKDK